MMTRKWSGWLIATALVAGLGCSGAMAQTVRMIVPTAPGGSVDLSARLLAERMRESSGTTIVVENRAGASSNLGAALVAKAAPDGNTLLVTADGVVTVNPTLYKDSGFSVSELAPVGMYGIQPSVLVVPTSSPIKSVVDFVAAAKQREMSYASAGVGSGGHLTMEYFGSVLGAKFLHVPFSGGGPAMQALIGEQVDSAFVLLPTALPHVKSGKLRALAVSGRERSASLPEVPTAQEAGFKEFEVQVAYLLMAPARTPATAIESWSKALGNALADTEFRKRLGDMGMQPLFMSPSATGEWLTRERVRWEALMRQHGIKAN